jgi:hypothetical protein
LLQLRLKEISGRAILHLDEESGLAALVIPVRVPPRIFRLKPAKQEISPFLDLLLGPPRSRARPSGRPGSRLVYCCDGRAHQWLRMTDFTEEDAFGRSFAYRCGK